MASGDVRLGEAPDAPSRGVCSSATAASASHTPATRSLDQSEAVAEAELDPLLMFGALQRQLGYPAVPRAVRKAQAPAIHPALEERLQRLSNLLAAGPALLPEERMLVAIHLKEVEQRLILDSEAEQQRVETATALAELDNENSRRLDAALAENARLRQQLEEAQQKLNAITNIERSIRERDNGSNSE